MTDGSSLLDFLDGPVVVGDPEGRVIYVNPAFERCFLDEGACVQGEGFAELFAGGGRESFLVAVAEVCETGQTVRFSLRENGRGYVGVASPIEAASDRVGVMIHLAEEPFSLQRLLALHREIEEPIDDVVHCLEELLDQTGGRRAERFRSVVEAALEASSRAKKWTGDLRSVLTGRGADGTAALTLDPVRAVRVVQTRAETECAGAQVGLDVLVPSSLPAVEGDGQHLETVLVRMVRDRLSQCSGGERLALGARRVALAGRDCVSFSLVAPPRADSAPVLRHQRDSIAELGGFDPTCIESAAGRVTAIVLPVSAGDA